MGGEGEGGKEREGRGGRRGGEGEGGKEREGWNGGRKS